MRPSSFLPALLLGATALMATPPADQSGGFFKDLAETRSFTNGLPREARFTPDGRCVLFLRSGPRDTTLQLLSLDLRTGKTEEVISPEALLKGAAERLTPEEKARRERQRETHRGFTSFQLSRDGRSVLLTLSGRVYVVDRASRAVTELPGQGWLDPKLALDGARVAAVQAGELHVLDLASGREGAVTSGATETLTHGLAEFAAQEELDRSAGYWWSPDGTRLLFEEADTSGVERLHIPDPADPANPPGTTAYPRAGRANAKVRLGLVAAMGGPITWLTWDQEKYPYLARVHWTAGAPPTLQVLTRDQRELALLKLDPGTGATTTLLTEKDPAWVNVDAFINAERPGTIPGWLPGNGGFLWMTERRGSTQVELRAMDGSLLRPLTPLGFEVTHVEDLDPGTRTFVVAGGTDPRESHLFRFSLDGGAPVQLTRGAGLHSAAFAADHHAFLDNVRLADGTMGTQVRDLKGSLLAALPSVAEPVPLLPSLELLRIGKERAFDAYVVRPRTFQANRKYPVILKVYAGPGGKEVVASAQAYLLHQWMADQGFIVVGLDGRGTPGHGRDWERAIKGNFIDVALADQVAGLKLLGERVPEMDLGRVGVSGWSFGGYFSAMATLRRPDVFKCGIAGAPVTDWLNYDTAYTERYLDLPSANPAGYAASSVLTYADQLARPLLLIHGLTDDNVLLIHSLQLMDALFRAGKPFEFLPMSGTHLAGSEDPLLARRLEERMMTFFKHNLQD